MFPAPLIRRGASLALAALVLFSSLTCMTVTCPAVCAAETGARLGDSPADEGANLPPCHREAAPTRLPAGDCESGTVCCSTWLHDAQGPTLPAPDTLRLPGVGPDLAILRTGALPAVAVGVARIAPAGPPGRCPAPLLVSRASRAPPATTAAA